MNGLDDAIKTIIDLSEQRAKHQVHMLPGGNDIAKKFVMTDGLGNEVSNHESDQLYECQTVEGLISLINDHTKRHPDDTVRVGVSGSRVTVWMSIDDRTHIAYYKLIGNTGFRWLEKAFFESGIELDQDELDWLIRSKFSGKINPLGFHAAIKALKFKSGTSGSRNISQGSETVDLEIESEIVGINQEDLSEQIAIETTVFDDELLANSSITVSVAVRINLAEKTFTLLPVDGEINAAYSIAMNTIAEHINENTGDQTLAIAGLDLFGKNPNAR